MTRRRARDSLGLYDEQRRKIVARSDYRQIGLGGAALDSMLSDREPAEEVCGNNLPEWREDEHDG